MRLNLRPDSEHARLSALRHGRESAWRGVFDEYAQPLFGFFFNQLGDRQAAEDLVQETFLSLVRSIRALDAGKGGLRPWLWTIARRRLADALRFRYREAPVRNLTDYQEELAAVIDNCQPLPDALLARSETRLFIGAVLSSLAEHYRTVLVEKYMHGCSTANIAGMMGQSAKAIESLLTRARIAFRERFEKMTAELNENAGQALVGNQR